MENYNNRMKQIEEVSESIAVANHQLNKLLQKFGWSKSHLKIEKESLKNCPFDKHHMVKEENYKKHVGSCFMKDLKIDSCDRKGEDTSSPLFSYGESNLVVPVFLKEKDYEKVGVNFNEFGVPLRKNKESSTDINKEGVIQYSLLEADNEINTYIPTDPLDELRFIYSWKLIPTKYIKIDTSHVNKEELSKWIKDQLPDRLQVGYQYHFIKNHCQTVDHPDRLCEILQPVLTNDARHFVIKLWKYVSAKTLCQTQNIAEHTRNEFDFYGSSSFQDEAGSNEYNEDAVKYSDSVLAKIPMEWIRCNLTREQKLLIYEEVCKVGKELCSPSLKFSELEAEAEHQMTVLTNLENQSGQKTHLEIIAEMRDFKRRRQSYRGKNKSNAKLTAIEVLREIVEQQMLYLDIVNGRHEEKPNEQDEKAKKESSKSPEPERSRSAERRKEKYNRREKRSRSRDRNRERRRNRSRSYDRKDRRRDRSKSRERYRKDSRERRRSNDKRHYKEHSRKDDIKQEKYRERSPFVKRDKERSSKEEISNVTYY